MSELSEVATSIARIAKDYRRGEIEPISPEFVAEWSKQFSKDVRLPLLRELDHVLGETYLSRRTCQQFLRGIARNQELTNGAPPDFWRHAGILDIQQNGSSQKDFLTLLDEELEAACGLSIDECGEKPKSFVYVDDALFTGGRAGTDLVQWIADSAPDQCELHLIFMVTHTLGEWQLRKRLNEASKGCGKTVEIKIWRVLELENRKAYSAASEVLWPTSIPASDEFAKLNSTLKFPFSPRVPLRNFKSAVFSSEEGRKCLEDAMLLAGLKIRALPQNPSAALKPLGFGPFGMGFGSTIVTFRNCPNNAPLALWWGDPEADSSHPFSKWTPLFPRKTYDANSAFKDFI